MRELRRFITAMRYEWLLQTSAWRWRLACAAALVCNLQWFFSGMNSLEFGLLDLSNHTQLALVIIALGFTAASGLSAVARTRRAGVHPILMVRPFHTFTFVAGLWAGAFASVTALVLLLAFPAGLFLHNRYEVEFYPVAFLSFIVFTLLPALAVVLAMAMWVRACLKNSLFAMLALGGLLFGLAWEANSGFSAPPEGNYLIRPEFFRPVLSAFSQQQIAPAWLDVVGGRSDFKNLAQWRRLALHLAGPALLLLLAGYHLRRTEPQRKVFRTYGRRWYHMPTFLRAACDLRTDPHVGWRSHLAVGVLVAVLAAPAVQAGLKGLESRRLIAERSHEAAGRKKTQGNAQDFRPQKVSDDRILPVSIRRVDGELSHEGMTLKVTFTCDADTSGRLAVIAWAKSFLWFHRSIRIEGREIPFTPAACHVIEGEALAPFCDGEEHILEMRGLGGSDATVALMGRQALLDVPTQPVCFVHRRISSTGPRGDKVWQYDTRPRSSYPATIRIRWPEPARLLDAPVAPDSSDPLAPVRAWSFSIPANRNGPDARILISPENAHQILSLGEPDRNLRFLVSDLNARTARQLLNETESDIRKLFETYRLEPSRPLTVNLERPMTPDASDFRRLRQLQQRYRMRHGRLTASDESQLIGKVREWRNRILFEAFSSAYLEGSPEAIDGLLDLGAFVAGNLQTDRLNPEPGMESLLFHPVGNPVSPLERRTILNMTREEMIAANKIPLFQMLYATLGHRDWLAMLRELRRLLQGSFFSVELLQEAAETAAGRSLAEFFDYWCRTGEGLPSFRVADARARWQRAPETGGAPRYVVEARVTNAGTGRFEVPVTLYCRGGVLRERVVVGPGETVLWQTTARSLPETIVVNEGSWFLAVPAWDQTSGQWLPIAQAPVHIESRER